MIRGALLSVALFASLPTAGTACRQALALGLDVSGSVDGAEYRMQVEGLARSLDNPEVRETLLSNPEMPVRIAVFEWSGPESQFLILPFTEITDAATLDRVVLTIAGAQRRPDSHTTAIGSAMQMGFALLADHGNKKENCFPMIPSGAAHNEMLLSKYDKEKPENQEKGKVLV